MEFTKPVSVLPRGTGIARLVKAIGLSDGHRASALEMATSAAWLSTPEVALTLKSEVFPIDVSTGSALIRYGMAADIIQLVRGKSVLAALKSRMSRVPFRTFFVKETSGSAGAWISSPGSYPIPVVQLAFAQSSLLPTTASTICVFSKELLKMSGVAAEAVITRSLTKAIAVFLDGQFLGPTLGPLTGERPGSITYTGLKFTSTGSTTAAIQADLEGMINLMTSWEDPVWITTPKLGAKLATLFGAPGVPFANIMGIPYFTSTNSPQQIVLVDLSRVIIADDEELDIASAEHASLVMTDTPQSSPAATSLVSLWQSDLAGVRINHPIAWQLAEASSAVTMTVTY